jgi:PAS domain S-box-containing protein
MKPFEDQLQTIVDTIPVLAWTARADGAAEFFNKRWANFTGLSSENAQDNGWMASVHTDDLTRLRDYWRTILESGEPGEIEVRLRRFDGVYRWFLFRATPSLDERGNVVKWFGVNVDIEERVGAEDALRQSEQSLRLIVDSIPGLICTMTAAGEVERVNQRILDYMGKTLEELRDWRDLLHQDDRTLVLSLWSRSVETGQPYDVEHRILGADGVYRWFHVRGLPLRDAERRIVCWYVLLIDSEERKRAEQDLQRQSEHLDGLFELAPEAVVLADENAQVMRVNREFTRMFGYTSEEAVGRSLRDLIVPEGGLADFDKNRASIESGERIYQECVRRRKDGVRLDVSLAGARVSLGAEQVAIYLIYRDITERRKADEKLRRSEAYLLEGQRLVRMFSWSHDASTGAVTCSPEMHRIFGVGPNEDASGTKFFFERMHPDDRPIAERVYTQARLAKASYEIDFRIILPNGAIKHIRSIGRPVLNESGGLLEFVGTSMDVTEQRQASARLENAFEEIKRLKDRLQDENVILREQIDKAFMFEEIVGASPALKAVVSAVSHVAPTDSTVLLLGDTGTGKELLARAIHKHSRRSQRAFVSINCAAIPQSLIASELFGHEKGAFTGAVQRRRGRFELAEGGTLFLDEIGDLPPDTQVALLRILQEREFERVGGTQPLKADVRVIAATNRDLPAAIAAGTFRSDLFYRINVFPIELPALRQRREDIPLLVEYFIDRYARQAGKTISGVDRNSMDLLRSYSWPGNIRELQNVIERAVIVSESQNLSIDKSWLSSPPVASGLSNEFDRFKRMSSQEQKAIIEAALCESEGRVDGPSGAAVRLGIPRSTLESKIRSLNINKHRFKADASLRTHG